MVSANGEPKMLVSPEPAMSVSPAPFGTVEHVLAGAASDRRMPVPPSR